MDTTTSTLFTLVQTSTSTPTYVADMSLLYYFLGTIIVIQIIDIFLDWIKK